MLFWTSSCGIRNKVIWSVLRPRRASSNARVSNPYPFPSNRNPTPHQIFHLPRNASENDVKARYFDLVRIYHPDKAEAPISSEEAHARFQSITAAYDVLRGKAPLANSAFSSTPSTFQDIRYPTTAAWRARSKRQELYGGKDERWKDRVILAGLIATIAIVVVQVFSTRRQALAEAIARNRHLNALEKRHSPATPSSLVDMHDSDKRLGE